MMGRGTSLATTEDHCSESWAFFLATSTDQRPDDRSLLSAAPRSEIEVDEGNVDLQMMMRWVAIGRSGNWGNWEIEKLRGSNSGGIDQVRVSQKEQGDMKATPGKESRKKVKKQVQKKKIKTDRSRSKQIRDREELAS